MKKDDYLKMLYIFNDAFDESKRLIISWPNGLKIKCDSITGIYETDTNVGDNDYIGEYAAAVEIVDILENGKDSRILISDNCIEISLKCIPEEIMTEDYKTLWRI